ncbi:MAG: biotin-dependent carboxyltransferase family protein [Pyrinomonadaceae bacterium]
MSLLIQKSGILTTVQDLGRHRFRRFGINPSGAMDPAAARLANILVGNDDDQALIETHFPAIEIRFESDAVAAIGGADLRPQLDDQPLENWRPFAAKKGSTLKFTGKITGNRSYLAVRGGIQTDRWLQSSSTNLAAKIGGIGGRKLAIGDRLSIGKASQTDSRLLGTKISKSLIPHYRPFPTVRIIAGAEYPNLSNRGRNHLLHQNFTISNNSNRMGFRLIGDPVTLSKKREFISSAVGFGTIQTLPDGQLIVLMADHQTAGGYPRIGHVISRDLPLLAQLGANDKVAFHLVDNEHAENLALEFERDLNFLRVAVRRIFC